MSRTIQTTRVPHAHMPTCPHVHKSTCPHPPATATPTPPYISRWQTQEGAPYMYCVPGWGLGGCRRAFFSCTTTTSTRPACGQAGFRAQLTATGTSQPRACTTHTAHTARDPAHAGRISIIPTHTTRWRFKLLEEANRVWVVSPCKKTECFAQHGIDIDRVGDCEEECAPTRNKEPDSVKRPCAREVHSPLVARAVRGAAGREGASALPAAGALQEGGAYTGLARAEQWSYTCFHSV
jgi:hypothetical protein